MRRQSTALSFTFAMMLAACGDGPALAPDPLSGEARFAVGGDGAAARALATLRRVTAPYHNLEAALADGFVLLHPCEELEDGPVGALYVHFGNLLDGVVDPARPDALLYEPARNGRHKLVGAEFAVPYALWPHAAPPEFLGNEFHAEDEFQVWALHVWLWRHNPDGMFAESNHNVSCDAG